MKKSFTLIEILVAIVIIGVLASLGILHYHGVTERARGNEARRIIGALRKACAAYYLQNGNTSGCTNRNLGVGNNPNEIPWGGNCRNTHYFTYCVGGGSGDKANFLAWRCQSNGKRPNAPSSSEIWNLYLVTNFSIGSDEWSSNYGY